jgi:hypothetical protein
MNISAEAIVATFAFAVSVAAYSKTKTQAVAAESAAKAALAQAETAANDARLRAIVDLLREFREQSFTETRHYIREKLLAENPNDGKGFAAIREESRRLKVLSVVHYFDQLGMLVEAKLVLSKDVARFMGKAVEDTWEGVLPYIQEERTRLQGSPMYGRNFDELVRHCNADSQSLGRKIAR